VPVEIAKTKMMTGAAKSFLSTLQKIVAAEGFWGLYTGFWVLMLRELPFTIIEM
jgi:solute carrier family 25 S-adenosylmethionine transporter 26